MKFEIKSRFDGSLLFSIETSSSRLAVEAAIIKKISLYGADLYGANLKGANLEGANLKGADLEGKVAWHVHHGTLWEVLTEPIKNRIAYIKSDKPKHEVATRLRLLKPIIGPLPEKITKVAMEALHKKECPACPWNGKTIFP